MEKKKIIIWDFDGPIVDSRELALELTQFQYEDVTEDIHRNLFNGNIFTELAKLKKKDISPEEHTEFSEKSYWPRKLSLVPIEGIKEVLETLSQDFTMVINSSSSEVRIENYLQRNDLSKYFDKIYGVESSKSKEEKFELILKDFDITNKECALITDTLGDVLEAKTLGIHSIVILWGYQEKKHFNVLDTEIIILEKPSELVSAVNNHFSVKL